MNMRAAGEIRFPERVGWVPFPSDQGDGQRPNSDRECVRFRSGSEDRHICTPNVIVGRSREGWGYGGREELRALALLTLSRQFIAATYDMYGTDENQASAVLREVHERSTFDPAFREEFGIMVASQLRIDTMSQFFELLAEGDEDVVLSIIHRDTRMPWERLERARLENIYLSGIETTEESDAVYLMGGSASALDFSSRSSQISLIGGFVACAILSKIPPIAGLLLLLNAVIAQGTGLVTGYHVLRYALARLQGSENEAREEAFRVGFWGLNFVLSVISLLLFMRISRVGRAPVIESSVEPPIEVPSEAVAPTVSEPAAAAAARPVIRWITPQTGSRHVALPRPVGSNVPYNIRVRELMRFLRRYGIDRNDPIARLLIELERNDVPYDFHLGDTNLRSPILLDIGSAGGRNLQRLATVYGGDHHVVGVDVLSGGDAVGRDYSGMFHSALRHDEVAGASALFVDADRLPPGIARMVFVGNPGPAEYVTVPAGMRAVEPGGNIVISGDACDIHWARVLHDGGFKLEVMPEYFPPHDYFREAIPYYFSLSENSAWVRPLPNPHDVGVLRFIDLFRDLCTNSAAREYMLNTRFDPGGMPIVLRATRTR